MVPTILKVLGIDPNELQVVQKEQTQVLSFLFNDEAGAPPPPPPF